MTSIPPDLLNTITTGDARVLAERLPDESVDLIFTDPVYDRIDDYRWLAETAARILKPNSATLVWQAVKWLPATMEVLTYGLSYRWQFIWYQSNRRGHCDFGYPLYTPLLWYELGKSKPRYPVQDIKNIPFSGDGDHFWQKQLETVSGWMDAFTQSGSVVFDPFTGGGTVPAVCKMLGRQYVAFEIDPDTAERARQRVAQTQPPLFVLQPEQVEMEL